MNDEELKILEQAQAILQDSGTHSALNLSRELGKLLKAAKTSGGRSLNKFTLATQEELKEDKLKHLVKTPTVQTGKRISLKEAAEKYEEANNVLATSEDGEKPKVERTRKK